MRNRGRQYPQWRPEQSGRRLRRAHHGGGAVVGALCFHVFGSREYHLGTDRPIELLGWALLVIGPLALAWRGRAPVAVLAISGAAGIGVATLATPTWTYAVAPVVALYAAVKAGHRRAAFTIAAAGYTAYLAILWICADPLGVPQHARADLRVAILTALGLFLTVFVGSASRARAAYIAEMTKVNAERARAKEEQERRQASDERLRIARELHDVLGHHLSLINVQAGVGLHLMDNRPEQAREALAAIKTASAEALREVRAVLGVLRPEEEAAPRQPALGLDRLGDLTADAGLPVTTTTEGPRRDLPAEVDRAAYRIVQEALTNVRRHAAPGAAVEIAVAYTPAELRLTISDDGTPKPAEDGDQDDHQGSGIAGMRARAASLGGTLTAGPLPEGTGYRVAAILPTATARIEENV